MVSSKRQTKVTQLMLVRAMVRNMMRVVVFALLEFVVLILLLELLDVDRVLQVMVIGDAADGILTGYRGLLLVDLRQVVGVFVNIRVMGRMVSLRLV